MLCSVHTPSRREGYGTHDVPRAAQLVNARNYTHSLRTLQSDERGNRACRLVRLQSYLQSQPCTQLGYMHVLGFYKFNSGGLGGDSLRSVWEEYLLLRQDVLL